MEWLFFILFGGMLIGFAAYGIKLYKEDKKILDEYKEKAPELPEGQDAEFISYERPFIEGYKFMN